MSNYTRIQARVIDQAIQLTNIPLIASGGMNEVKVDFTFCSKWDSLGKTAVFYRNPEQAFHVVLVDNSAVVPAEVLETNGLFYFGVFGASDAQVRTTEVTKLTVVKGAVTIPGIEPTEPTPDIYSQLLSAYGKMADQLAKETVERKEEIAVERARINSLVEMKGSGDLTVCPLGENGVRGSIEHNGVAAFIRYECVLAIPAGESQSVPIVPIHLAPIAAQLLETNEGLRAILASEPLEGEAVTDHVSITVWNDTDETFVGLVEAKGVYPLAAVSVPELSDIRIGVDGNVYATAGEAVRAQIKDLKNQPKNEVHQSVVISTNGDPLEDVVLETETRGSGAVVLQHYSGGFEQGSEVPTILGNVADGERDSDAATVGQVKEMIEQAGGSAEGAVLYTEQTLTEEQQAQARQNIGVENAIPKLYGTSENPVILRNLESGVYTLSGYYKTRGADTRKSTYGDIILLVARANAWTNILEYSGGGQSSHGGSANIYLISDTTVECKSFNFSNVTASKPIIHINFTYTDEFLNQNGDYVDGYITSEYSVEQMVSLIKEGKMIIGFFHNADGLMEFTQIGRFESSDVSDTGGDTVRFGDWNCGVGASANINAEWERDRALGNEIWIYI